MQKAQYNILNRTPSLQGKTHEKRKQAVGTRWK